MAKYRITGPDGATYEITAPDDASESDVLAYAQQNYASAPRAADFSDVRTGSSTKGAQGLKPSLFRMDSDFSERSGVGFGPKLVASVKDMFGSHESAAKYLAEQAGGRAGKDERGEPVVILSDGTTYRVNDDGLDSTDVANVAGNIGAFFTPATWAARFAKARGMGLAGRSALQGVTAGATDAAAQAAVNQGDVDVSRTALTTAGGAGGELLGTGLSAAVNRGRALYRSKSGANRETAAQVATDAGLTPTPERVAQYAGRADELEAGIDPRALVGQQEYGLIYTQGQRMADPARKFELLSQEELLRQSPGGNEVFASASRSNEQRVNSVLSNMGENLGGRPGATPAELAQGAAARLSGQADELGGRISAAYDKASAGGRTAIRADAVLDLPSRLRTAVQEFSPNAELTPATAKTLEQIARTTENMKSFAKGGNVSGVTLRALETQRRILNNNINAAANPADRAAMTRIKREFDGWLDDSIDNALLSGDPEALKAIKEARGLRFEFGKRFEGKTDTDRFITGLLDGSRSPEELVNIALGASQVSKAGGARFVERLKTAAGNDPEVIGQLRAAHFLRMTQDKSGQTLGFGQLVRNIRQTEYSNGSMVKALYSPKEWGEIRRLADSLEPLLPSGEFQKSSGTAERLARMMFQKVGGGLPLVGDLVKGFADGVNTVRAQSAVNKPLRLKAVSHPLVPATITGSATEPTR